jgi:predicted ATPase
VVAQLADADGVLVLDNCEHVVRATAEVAAAVLGAVRTYASSPPADDHSV